MPDQAEPAARPKPAHSEPTRPADVHRQLVELYPELLASGRLDAGLAFIDPDVIDHRGGADGDHRGRAAWRQKWERMAARGYGFTDPSVTIEQNVAAGDISVNRYTSRGTDPATGRRFAVTSMDMVRVRDGRVVEHWAVMDAAAIRHQLSAASEPASAS
jgi:predicted SnoaL-like aldol condensation-catalyzing enzyme